MFVAFRLVRLGVFLLLSLFCTNFASTEMCRNMIAFNHKEHQRHGETYETLCSLYPSSFISRKRFCMDVCVSENTCHVYVAKCFSV